MKKTIIAALFFASCTKSEPIKPIDTISDYRSDTTYVNCQMVIYTSWNTYRNGEVFQSFDAKKVIGQPCVNLKRDEKIPN
jgi:hypothetical protein